MRRRSSPDAVADVAGARTGIGGIVPKTPGQVRAAQLALASVANDPVELREVLQALGIFNRRGRVDGPAKRRTSGTIQRYGVLPTDREPSGRPSRAAARRRRQAEEILRERSR